MFDRAEGSEGGVERALEGSEQRQRAGVREGRELHHQHGSNSVVRIEYEVYGKKIATGNSYDNRFMSVVTIEDRKIVRWRDYRDSLAAMTALRQASTGAGKRKWLR